MSYEVDLYQRYEKACLERYAAEKERDALRARVRAYEAAILDVVDASPDDLPTSNFTDALDVMASLVGTKGGGA